RTPPWPAGVGESSWVQRRSDEETGREWWRGGGFVAVVGWAASDCSWRWPLKQWCVCMTGWRNLRWFTWKRDSRFCV
ncbi:hypothetical protein VIGAN_06071200, partial [Vigna angularis var. angularis]